MTWKDRIQNNQVLLDKAAEKWEESLKSSLFELAHLYDEVIEGINAQERDSRNSRWGFSKKRWQDKISFYLITPNQATLDQGLYGQRYNVKVFSVSIEVEDQKLYIYPFGRRLGNRQVLDEQGVDSVLEELFSMGPNITSRSKTRW